MEIEYKDPVAREKCKDNMDKIVAIVHTRLGGASVVFISDCPERSGLKLETGAGSIVVNYDLTKIAEEAS